MTKQSSPTQGSKEAGTIIDPFKISLNVYQYLKEMEKEIEQEFIETLKNNVINPYKTTVLLGEKFAFVYIGARRYKHIIQFKFLILRRNEVDDVDKKYRRTIGKIYVSVRIGGGKHG